MRPILTINNPFADARSLKIYASFEQDGETIYPMELNNDTFMLRWSPGCLWHCHGIEGNDTANLIGRLVEDLGLFVHPEIK